MAYLFAVLLALCPGLGFAAQLTLTWSDQSDNEAEFRVYRRLSSVPTYTLLVTLPSNAETYVDTSVLPNESYTYQVTAANSAGESAPSNEASGVFILAAVGDMLPIQISFEEITADPNLVLAFGFDEGSGTVTADASGKNNTGTINGPTWSAQGKFGGALSFNGASMVTVADSATLDLTDEMTLEAWVYPTTATGGWQDIIFKANDMYYLSGSSPQGGAFAVGGTFGTNANLYGTTSLPLNTWSHLAATYDGITLRLFVNGIEVASRAQTGQIQVSSLPLTIGGDTIYGQYWQGRIDEVRVYNRALSQVEIQNDMTTGVQ